MGGISWNAGSYNPRTRLFYKIGYEWCIDLEVVKTTPVLEPMAQLNIGADFSLVNPPDGKVRGHISARDPLTGAKKWEVEFPEPRDSYWSPYHDRPGLGLELSPEAVRKYAV